MNRVGNKRRIADLIIPYMPPHKTYVEPFFGGGGMFFSKPRAKFNFCNDIDGHVINYFKIRMTRNKEFIELAESLPIAKEFWNLETDDLIRAVLFWQSVTFSLYGTGNTLLTKNKNLIIPDYDFKNVKLTNMDATKFVSSLNDVKDLFIYADPPYIESCKKYKHNYTIEQLDNFLEVCKPYRTMVSSYCNMESYFKEKGYEMIKLKEIQTIKNRQNECIFINYDIRVGLYD